MLNRLQVVVALAGSLMVAGAASAQTPAQIDKGMQVYAAQKCSICHAIAGKGNAKGPLEGVGTRLSADEIHQWIVDAPGMTAKTKAPRKPVMKAYTALSKEDTAALVAYLQSLKK